MFYTNRLSKRLVHGASVSDESESSMISKLEEACGFEYTIRLQFMLTDFHSSKELTDQFRKHMEQSYNNMDICFSIMVPHMPLWPLSAPNNNFIDIQPTHDRFQKHYQVKHLGHKLTWLWNYSTNELQTHYFDKEYILMTSSYQMAGCYSTTKLTCCLWKSWSLLLGLARIY